MKVLRLFLPVMVVACVVGSLLPGRALAAEEPYPTRPIQIIVPFPPGGVADLVALSSISVMPEVDAPEFQKFWDADADRLVKAVRNIGKVQ